MFLMWHEAMLDVPLNAFYLLLVILHFICLVFIDHVILADTVVGYLVGDILWLTVVSCCIYAVFPG